MIEEEKKYLYRYEDYLTSSCSITIWGGEEYYTHLNIHLRKFLITKETPKGCWILDGYFLGHEAIKGNKFVLNDARKKFACRTIEEAKKSFKARKAKQIKILKSQLNRAERAYTSTLPDDERSVEVPYLRRNKSLL